MTKILCATFLAASAMLFAACEPPKPAANNANAVNTNANAAKPAAAAPTKESLLEMDKKANEAYLKGDSKFFEGMLADKFVMYDMGKREDKASSIKMIAGVKCDVKTWSLDEPQMTMIDADTAALVYKGTFDGTCNGPDGKAMKLPSPVRAASVWTRSGDKWMAVYHAEVPIVDPKNPPKATAPAPPAKMEANKNSNASNSVDAKPAAPAADPVTDALMAVEKAGWEAWKARDAKKLEDLTAANLAYVDLFGNYTATKADTIKAWTGSQCTITSVSVTDGVGTTLSPTLALLTFKGSGEGTCEGMKLKPVYGTSFYVKEGDTWKLAFGVESPA